MISEVKPPSPKGPNRLQYRRDKFGRFLPGGPGGPGNPHSRKVEQLRSAMLKAVTRADMTAIIKSMVKQAKGGDVAAAKLLLDRCLGRTASEFIDFRPDDLPPILVPLKWPERLKPEET